MFDDTRRIGSKRPASAPWLPVVIAGTFALSVISLAVLSMTGQLHDDLYGGILMGIMTIPLSFFEIAASLAVEGVNPDLLANVATAWVSLLTPGLLEALLLWLLLHRGWRTEWNMILAKTLAVWTTALVIFAGIAILVDQYTLRRPSGIPLLVLGSLQASFVYMYFRRARLYTKASSKIDR